MLICSTKCIYTGTLNLFDFVLTYGSIVSIACDRMVIRTFLLKDQLSFDGK